MFMISLVSSYFSGVYIIDVVAEDLERQHPLRKRGAYRRQSEHYAASIGSALI
jgi:hypothetical protein